MIVSLIVAMSENRVIGKDNALPWHLPEDLKRFKRITTGHCVIMGRKTHESIGKLLPNRTNIILTKDESFRAPGATLARSFDEAIRRSSGKEIFIIGGAEVYREALKRADRIYLTLIHDQIVGDAFFPEFDEAAYTVTERKDFPDPLPHSFRILTKRKPRLSKPRVKAK